MSRGHKKDQVLQDFYSVSNLKLKSGLQGTVVSIDKGVTEQEDVFAAGKYYTVEWRRGSETPIQCQVGMQGLISVLRLSPAA